MSTRSMRRLGAILVLVLLVTALMVPAASAAPAQGSYSQGCPVYYRVVPGDTLTKIAYRYGVSVGQLQSWNHISNPDRIYIGQTLVIYPYNCTRPHPKPRPHPWPPPPPPPTSFWMGQFYNSKDLTGPVVAQLSYPAPLYANWGWGSPAPGVNADNFSARFNNTSNLSGGVYRITLRTDDGARVYVDGMLVIDAWRIQAVTGYFVDISLPRGFHTFMVDYFENDQVAELGVKVQRLY